jgi:hypothetical protein
MMNIWNWLEEINRMRVILKDSVYEMGETELLPVLKIARKAVPRGIYAIEKNGIVVMTKEQFEDLKELRSAVRAYRLKGYKVYWNGSGR